MSTTSATKQWVFSDVGHCLAFGFGAGLTPKIPGTAGTVLAFPLYWLSAQWLWQIQWLLVLVLIVLGIWLCGRACRALGQHDDSGVVLDEIAAFYMVLLLTPSTWQWQAAAFAVFRLLDSLKPPPINWLDKYVKGGTGIMVDDLAAAALTVVIIAAPQFAVE
ncbi:phosphatidylglycerophosphatase A [Candidatus Persebacteraceae bacterium Df01]|jgi:phosphatidylglycerophosphatase A|uniref:Phosphatidylglycerophosphatase A n=1 Tax=Candidatus Doriopsillibacter californiensis TaxID=2970740 RepID=A0ABT7QM52_9GAMM|nr:phosphatidylglycerophosphatase A [Candidatus Persebacteraceae bacterium Df01]